MDPGAIEIRLFGEFELLQGGVEVPAPTLKKARILVAHLALHAGHEFVRDDLSTHL
jgi:DNA-binding SARP family transcriptional activator